MTGPCPCHAPAVFGHRSDCEHGHKFIQTWTNIASPSHARALAFIATTTQADIDRPLTLDEDNHA
jgi:hypothetical protein